MPLSMTREVFITCAVTQTRSPEVPRSPKNILNTAITVRAGGPHCRTYGGSSDRGHKRCATSLA
jgi:uncharacterized protein (DUF849 family)